ncbi:MAG: hypothetical protein GF334_06295 [Candidatus Altiarchaeales archaeon]|nr:hypothetical protein [Candidatus Altiarchaeales archaeon]
MYLDSFVQRASSTLIGYEEPLSYLKRRGVDEDDIKYYSIGYCKIVRIPKSNSCDYKLLFEATNEFRRLKEKILFPLRNVLGRVNGLVVRRIDKKQYTQYFLTESKKIGAFFGLYEALPHIQRTKKVFVHEGALDSISFAKVFPNTVSSLTSFLNEQQYELLRFFADKIILIYDRDEAGYLGVQKMMNAYGNRHIESIFLGDNDANQYYQTMGYRPFEKFLRSRIPSILQV